MRVLHVTHELPPYETAGVAVYSYNLGRAQSADNEVHFFARLQDLAADDYRMHTETRDGVTIRFIVRKDLQFVPLEGEYLEPKVAELFEAYLDELRPDVVHVHHAVGLGLELFAVLKRRNIPTVLSLHDFWSTCAKGQRMCYTDRSLCETIDFQKCGPCVYAEGWDHVRPLLNPPRELPVGAPAGLGAAMRHHYREVFASLPSQVGRRPRALAGALARALRSPRRTEGKPLPDEPFERRFEVFKQHFSSVDVIASPSQFLREDLIRQFDLPPSKVIHSTYGMDFSYAKPLPKAPSPRVRFGYIGSLMPTKGVHVAIGGFLAAATTCPNIELAIHGSASRWHVAYADELKAMVDQHPAKDRVTFHGRFDNRLIAEIHAKLDVLIMPSIWFENSPLTLNEAAMTRTGVLTSDKGGMEEFVRTNHYGRTFELGNPESLAAAIREVANDKSKLAALVGDAPKIRSVETDAQGFLDLYESLLAQRRSRRS